MTLATLGLALLWAPVSFVEHTALHEGSHALVGTMSGAHVSRLSLLPEAQAGHLRFAYVQFREPPRHSALVAAAPLLFEALWFTVAAAIAHAEWCPPWLRTILRVEMAASYADTMVWFAGALGDNPLADARKVWPKATPASRTIAISGGVAATLLTIRGEF